MATVNLVLARELAKKYPRETAGFSVKRIEAVWSIHSGCDQWREPESAQEVEEVFDRYVSFWM